MKVEDFNPELLDDYLMIQSAMLFQAEAALHRMHGRDNRESQRKVIDAIKHGVDFVFHNRRELGI